jgi:hypothetical protein
MDGFSSTDPIIKWLSFPTADMIIVWLFFANNHESHMAVSANRRDHLVAVYANRHDPRGGYLRQQTR